MHVLFYIIVIFKKKRRAWQELAAHRLTTTDLDLYLRGSYEILERKKKLRGFSPPANYTDRATAAC
jgi:hypothetical protein